MLMECYRRFCGFPHSSPFQVHSYRRLLGLISAFNYVTRMYINMWGSGLIGLLTPYASKRTMLQLANQWSGLEQKIV
ncbi:unnamed protein product [Camellia sinensis]